MVKEVLNLDPGKFHSVDWINEDEVMKKKLLQSALISTPILAFYVIIPLFIFRVFVFPDVVPNVVALSVNIFIVWMINIYLCLRYHHYAGWKRGLISYGVNLVFQAIFMLIPVIFEDTMHFPGERYLLYPSVTFIGFNAIILLICNSVLIAEHKTSADIEIQALKYQNSEAQKQILLQQLHPHFLFNALSVLKSLIRENPLEAGTYALKLSDFLRYSVKAPKLITVPLQEELEFTIGYIELQKARFENSFTWHIDIPAAYRVLRIPVYALQTLVENAFKHNYFTEKNSMHIEIFCRHNMITVLNNKVSLKITERSGTGLVNLNERHRLITGNDIIIEEGESTFSVTLQLLPVNVC